MPTTKRCPFNSNPHSLNRFDHPSRVPITVVEFGGIDTLVNSAGVLSIGPIDELSLKDFDRTIAVNVRAVFVATQAAVKHMKADGRIINIGSCNAERMPFGGGCLRQEQGRTKQAWANTFLTKRFSQNWRRCVTGSRLAFRERTPSQAPNRS